MSWLVEQSESTSSVTIQGNTVTCVKDGFYGSPINVMYKDPAAENGQYYWQIEFEQVDQDGYVSVGLTTEQGFQPGWGLKAMKYLGNLSSGSALLVSAFGDKIKQNDRVGILLQLTSTALQFYIFHNERPLGLAFHVQSPYPTPLYPVVSFDANGKANIQRLGEIPRLMERSSLQFNGVEGHWTIVDYAQHPECVGYKFEITSQNTNQYRLHTKVINSINCSLVHDPTNNKWSTSPAISTMMAGPPGEMNKERLLGDFIAKIENLEIQDQQNLVIRTRDGYQAQLQRFTPAPPSPVTENVFN